MYETRSSPRESYAVVKIRLLTKTGFTYQEIRTPLPPFGTKLKTSKNFPCFFLVNWSKYFCTQGNHFEKPPALDGVKENISYSSKTLKISSNGLCSSYKFARPPKYKVSEINFFLAPSIRTLKNHLKLYNGIYFYIINYDDYDYDFS